MFKAVNDEKIETIENFGYCIIILLKVLKIKLLKYKITFENNIMF